MRTFGLHKDGDHNGAHDSDPDFDAEEDGENDQVLFKRRRIQERAATPPSVLSFGSSCVESGVYCVHHSTLKKMTDDRSHDNAEQDVNQVFGAHSPLGLCGAPAGRGLAPQLSLRLFGRVVLATMCLQLCFNACEDAFWSVWFSQRRGNSPPVEHYAPLAGGNCASRHQACCEIRGSRVGSSLSQRSKLRTCRVGVPIAPLLAHGARSLETPSQ